MLATSLIMYLHRYVLLQQCFITQWNIAHMDTLGAIKIVQSARRPIDGKEMFFKCAVK